MEANLKWYDYVWAYVSALFLVFRYGPRRALEISNAKAEETQKEIAAVKRRIEWHIKIRR